MVRFPPWQSFSHVFFRPTSLAFIVSCHLKHYWFLGSEGEASSPFAKFNLLNLFCSILIISRALSWSHLQSLEDQIERSAFIPPGKSQFRKTAWHVIHIYVVMPTCFVMPYFHDKFYSFMLSCQHVLSCHVFKLNLRCCHVNMFCHAMFSNILNLLSFMLSCQNALSCHVFSK